MIDERFWTPNCVLLVVQIGSKRGPKKGPKRVQKGSKNKKNQIFVLDFIVMIDESILSQNCLKCTLRCPRGKKGTKNLKDLVLRGALL